MAEVEAVPASAALVERKERIKLLPKPDDAEMQAQTSKLNDGIQVSSSAQGRRHGSGCWHRVRTCPLTDRMPGLPEQSRSMQRRWQCGSLHGGWTVVGKLEG